ncbi:MAG: Crp/Fnr family transcriptional regulator [Rhodospirillales bacterium]|nr:Crp/Fnr family transcriptional regulator [Rhodospirillales bacterium]
MSDKRRALRDVFAQHNLLGVFSPEDLDRLAAVSLTRTYRPGQNIFLKGDLGDSMMAVLSGRVRISSNSADGREVVLAVLEPGELMGEIAMIDGGERTADAVALAPTDLLILSRRDFLPCLRQSSEACWKLLMIMAQRLRRTDEQVEDMSFLPLKIRLAKRLLFLADHYGEPSGASIRISIHLPQQLLASMVSTSREAVNKQLRAWHEAGVVDVKRGVIIVLDREALEDVVSEEPQR